MTKIQISACTFRRPDGLRALLESIETLVLPDDVTVTVCIVDNDTEASARSLILEVSKTFPLELVYAHEAAPGIPSARNRALDEAINADYVAFIDDDETVDPNWLISLWEKAKDSKAHFIQGPVHLTVANPADAWWLRTRFFKHAMFDDGARRYESWSNNVLVDMHFVRQHNLRFDEVLAMDGGTDTLFFQDMVRAGAEGVFAANAWVREEQPMTRLKWRWAVQRQFRYGVTRANVVMMREKPISAIPHCIARSGAMAIVGTGMFLSSLFRGRIGFADGVAFWCRSAGVLAGMVGHRHREYKRPTA